MNVIFNERKKKTILSIKRFNNPHGGIGVFVFRSSVPHHPPIAHLTPFSACRDYPLLIEFRIRTGTLKRHRLPGCWCRGSEIFHSCPCYNKSAAR